jgi:hypothetical protein
VEGGFEGIQVGEDGFEEGVGGLAAVVVEEAGEEG